MAALLLNLNFETYSVEAKKCRAIAMSGGGSFGAYEGGALWGMWHTAENKEDYEYDVATGVSAGGINAYTLGMFEKGDERNMLYFMIDMWQGFRTSDFWKYYPVKDWGHMIDGMKSEIIIIIWLVNKMTC